MEEDTAGTPTVEATAVATTAATIITSTWVEEDKEAKVVAVVEDAGDVSPSLRQSRAGEAS